MGKFSKGILGGFSGTVGNVVGANWKGIDYMRSKANRTNFTPTDAQLGQQLKFSLAMRFVQSISGLVADSFRSFAVRKTGMNSALSYTITNAIDGIFPNLQVEYSTVLVSRGDLPNVLNPAAAVAATGILTFTWTDNTGVGIAKSNDKAILVAYCPAKNQSIYSTGPALRSAGTGQLNIAGFKGEQVETYIGFMSDNKRNTATSIYTRQVTVP